METRFLIIDGNSLVCRAVYANVHANLKSKEGIPTGGTLFFFNMLISVLNKLRPTHLVVAFDVSRHTFRSALDANYKANRYKSVGSNGSLIQQLKQVQALLQEASIPCVAVPGFEADDVIGTYVTFSEATHNYILTGDRDAFQLINDQTTVLYPKTGISKLEHVDVETFKQRFNVDVKHYADYKALIGDVSDNITGCPGCGPKNAVNLLTRYEGLVGLRQHAQELPGKLGKRLQAWLPNSEHTSTLVTIRRDVPVPYNYAQCTYKPTFSHLLPTLATLELSQLSQRIVKGDIHGQN